MTKGRDGLAAVFERAPGLAERLAAHAEEPPEAIVSAARLELDRMTEAERVAVLDAHPRIGADPASLSVLSRGEQRQDADSTTLVRLAQLNEEYERTFGFRFVVFVRGRSNAEIIPVMRERLGRPREQELATGIEEFLAITQDRLERARM